MKTGNSGRRSRRLQAKVAFFSLVSEDFGEGSTNLSPACAVLFFSFLFFFFFFLKVAVISLGQLRRLRTSVPRQVAREVVALIGSHIMPGQYIKSVPTSWGQGCMCIYDYP